jgi:hypothetical protein
MRLFVEKCLLKRKNPAMWVSIRWLVPLVENAGAPRCVDGADLFSNFDLG